MYLRGEEDVGLVDRVADVDEDAALAVRLVQVVARVQPEVVDVAVDVAVVAVVLAAVLVPWRPKADRTQSDSPV